jgi:hypothetical protein
MRLKKVGRPRLGKRALSGAQRVAAYTNVQREAGKQRISVWIDVKDLSDLKAQAAFLNTSLGGAIEMLIRNKEKAR